MKQTKATLAKEREADKGTRQTEKYILDGIQWAAKTVAIKALTHKEGSERTAFLGRLAALDVEGYEGFSEVNTVNIPQPVFNMKEDVSRIECASDLLHNLRECLCRGGDTKTCADSASAIAWLLDSIASDMCAAAVR